MTPDTICPDCKYPISTHELYRDAECPVVRWGATPTPPEGFFAGPSAITPLEMAADAADWDQVIGNGGPPCFAMDVEIAFVVAAHRFCLRAERWQGHPSQHAFIPLSALIVGLERRAREWQERAMLSLDQRDEEMEARETAEVELAALRKSIITGWVPVSDADVPLDDPPGSLDNVTWRKFSVVPDE